MFKTPYPPACIQPHPPPSRVGWWWWYCIYIMFNVLLAPIVLWQLMCVVLLQWPTSLFTVGYNSHLHTREPHCNQSYESSLCRSISKGLSALLQGDSVAVAEGEESGGDLLSWPTLLQPAIKREGPFISLRLDSKHCLFRKIILAFLQTSLFICWGRQFALRPRFQYPRVSCFLLCFMQWETHYANIERAVTRCEHLK